MPFKVVLLQKITRKVRKVPPSEMTENQIGRIIVDRSLKVHKALGPGLLESTYQACLAFELNKSWLFLEREKGLPVIYKDVKLECGYRIYLIVERKVIIEIKSVAELNDVHLAQILTYLKLSNTKLGYLINFNVPLIKRGIKRVVNNL